MSWKKYLLLTILTLALFIIALVRPGFVLNGYESIVSLFAFKSNTELTGRTNQSEIIDVQNINFDISTSTDASATTTPSTYDVESRNHLQIPSIGVDADISMDPTQAGLKQGLWHVPGSAVPGNQGNVVISAHRWLYKPPSPKTFYNIDKINIGDTIYYEYGNNRYTYRVTEHFIVDPSEVHILSQEDDKLTLFTCHPLFSSSQRYVVVARLVASSPISS